MDDVLNQGRLKVSDALTKVVSHYFGRDNMSEATLKNAWMEEVSSHPELTDNSWYNPPAQGSAVLVGKSNDVSRRHFKAFRDPLSFANHQSIYWRDFILVAYASNVDKDSGVPSDYIPF